MSYILDALKKSEQERKMGSLPDINSDHNLLGKPPVATEKNPLYWFLAAMLFIALSLSVFFYTGIFAPKSASLSTQQSANNQTSNQTSNETNVVMAGPKPQSAPVRQQVRSEPPSVQLNLPGTNAPELIRPDPLRRQQIVLDNTLLEQEQSLLKEHYRQWFQDQSQPVVPAEQAPENVEPVVIEDAVVDVTMDIAAEELLEAEILGEQETISPRETSSQNPATDASVWLETVDWHSVPTIAALQNTVKATLPKIAVSTHIYSSYPGFRKATINQRSMKAGDYVYDNLKLLSIREDGVILQFEQTLFRMNALEEWKGR